MKPSPAIVPIPQRRTSTTFTVVDECCDGDHRAYSRTADVLDPSPERMEMESSLANLMVYIKRGVSLGDG